MQQSSEQRSRPKVRAGREARCGFNRTPIVECGHQTGKDRFPNFSPGQLRNDEQPIPYLNAWRNNLTALSRAHDLYFVAYEDEIHVFRPKFPSYHIQRQAALVLRLPTTSPNLPGHMPASKPHSVNNMLVEYFGHLEILLCCCDDGDVLAYWTDKFEYVLASRENIHLDAQRRELLSEFTSVDVRSELECAIRGGSEKSQSSHEVRKENLESVDGRAAGIHPFLHSNIGHSAWGLAVHTEERLMAVSANDRKITIFQFGYSEDSPTESLSEHDYPYNELRTITDRASEDGFWDIDENLQKRHFLKDHLNVRWSLDGHHKTNIPNIGFQFEPECPLLISTDISGLTIVWDIIANEPLYKLAPRYHLDDLYSNFGLDLSNAGWGVISIDPRAFVPVSNVVEAMGSCTALSYHDIFVLDISHSKAVSGGSSPLHLDSRTRTLTTAPELSATESTAVPQDSGEDIQSDPDDQPDSSTTSYNTPEARKIHLLNQNQHIPHKRFRDDLELSRHPLGSSFLFGPMPNPRNPHPLYGVKNNHHMYGPFGGPLLHLSPRTLTLFQNLTLHSRSRASPPIVFSDPLHQPYGTEQLSRSLKPYDRMNLHQLIPELGVLLVGSQKGRVGVFSLRSWRENPFVEGKPLFSVRLDWVLPMEGQERRGVRPMQPLVGLAAGPVRGAGGGGGVSSGGKEADVAGGKVYGKGDLVTVRRWRVLLMYRDHTLLSYEISRDGADGLTVS